MKHIIILGIALLVALSGCATETTEGPIKIGNIGPLTGDVAFLGVNVKVAVGTAIEEINAEGGINGRLLEGIYEDGGCGPKEGANAANKLINIDGVDFIIGGLCSGETLGAAPIAEEAGVVLFSPTSSNPDITNSGDYIFRSYPSDAFQGKVAAEYVLNDLAGEKIAIMNCQGDWCVGVKNVFKEHLLSIGGNIVAEEDFAQGSVDLRSQLTKVKDSDPDVVYILSYTQSGVALLTQMKELGIDAKVLGGDSWADDTLWEQAASAGDGARFLVPSTPPSEEFDAKMKAKGIEASLGTQQGYDNVMILADIFREFGTNPVVVKEALYNVKDYQGFSGVITIDSNGDLEKAVYDVKEANNGVAAVI